MEKTYNLSWDYDTTFRIEAVTNAAVAFTIGSDPYQYSYDKETWSDMSNQTAYTVNVGQSFYVRISPTYTRSYDITMYPSLCTGTYNVLGKIGPLLSNLNSLAEFFKNCTGLIDASRLIMPESSTGYLCYSMFSGCTNLVSAPSILPATKLIYSSGVGYGSYEYMFYNCTSLTKAPVIKATEIGYAGCYYMFYNCDSLTTAPELPATTLASYCYRGMFSCCGNLTNAMSELPATTVSIYGYGGMFYNCPKLVNAPVIRATTLNDKSCIEMFRGCSLLNISNTSGTAFFTCPSLTGLTDPVKDMFYLTAGYTTDPTEGNTYYYN